ncbi:MAG: glycosyltransferase family 2 protein [Pyrinomonadaceae bacterium]
MSSKHPYFSIVMPTRNRAEMLSYAIKSVLNQDFEDFEIIASDNFSTDNTYDVVNGFGDKRLQYFKTPAPFSIDESWNFAISKATGRYITFLSDDDAYLSFRLKKAFEVISRTDTKLLVHKYAGYYPKGNEFQTTTSSKLGKNSLTIPWFSGKFAEVNAQDTIHHVYSKLEHYFTHPIAAPIYFSDMPHVSDAFYHQSIIENVSRKVPKIINSRQGDIYLGVNVLNEVEKYGFLDMPLTIFSTYPEQTTSQSTMYGMQGNRAKADAETKFKQVPLKFWTPTNSLADILLEVLNDNSSIDPKVQISWDNYFSKCSSDLAIMENAGINVDKFRKELNETVKEYVENGLVASESLENENQQRNLKQMFWQKVENFSMAKNFRMRIDKSANARYWRKLIFDGNIYGFMSILDCANFMEESFFTDVKEFWLGRSFFLPRDSKLN